MTDDLTKALLAKPVGPSIPARQAGADDYTRKVEVKGDQAEVELRGREDETGPSAARDYLEKRGENPDFWEPTGMRSSEWTMANGELGVSVRYTYRRLPGAGERPALDELIAQVRKHRPKAKRAEGNHGAVVALGDMQFGKIDGDGVEGTLTRVLDGLDRAADRIEWYRKRFDIGHVHVAWLGDHVEGFNSQGGANVWRTVLTMNEQIRLVRRVMLHALGLFAPMAEAVSMAAVPGNHGEPQRFMGSGITRYDDSHDTESLIAVWEAAQLNPEAFGHVSFLVPETDELTVVTEVAGTTVAHAHGHQWRVGKHFEWWRGQAFHSAGLNAADLLLAGHLHHLLVETDGKRTFLQVPSLESESTWFRHTSGSTGNPGLVLAIVHDGTTNVMEVVQ